MARLLAVLCLLLICVGCQSGIPATTLNPEEFTAVTLMGKSLTDTNNAATAEGGGTNDVVEATLKKRLIVPGSQLIISVAEDPSLNKEFLISPGTAIEFPPLGRLDVEGLTGDELQQTIKERLERDFFRTATVEVKVNRNEGGGVIYVLGSVGRPGPIAFPVNQKFTVLQAILAAGGAGEFGNESNIQIIRYGDDGKKYRTVVNLARIKKQAEFEKDIPLINGDWLIVGEKLFNF